MKLASIDTIDDQRLDELVWFLFKGICRTRRSCS